MESKRIEFELLTTNSIALEIDNEDIPDALRELADFIESIAGHGRFYRCEIEAVRETPEARPVNAVTLVFITEQEEMIVGNKPAFHCVGTPGDSSSEDVQAYIERNDPSGPRIAGRPGKDKGDGSVSIDLNRAKVRR